MNRVRGLKINYLETYFCIVDTMLLSLRERLEKSKEFEFFDLLNYKNFQTFPTTYTSLLNEIYPDIFYT